MTYAPFLRLEEEKQKRIINAALDVFTQSPFRYASTDDIAARAQIAKGSLFQYFKNKRALYLFLYQHSLTLLREQVDQRYDDSLTDYFAILRHGMELKFQLLKEYPNLYQFVIRACEEEDCTLSQEISSLNSKMQETAAHRVFANIDYSRFKEDADLPYITKLITWCSEGIWQEGVKEQRSMEDMLQEGLRLLSFFRQASYKPECINNEE